MTSPPRVSIVMTVWNGEKYIAESISSVLNQTFRDLELIIIDDGSTDGTCAVVESFHDERIRLVRRPHEGVVPSANCGVSLAQAEYVARLDADDISLETRIARQVAALDAHPRAVLCYANIEVFGETGLGSFSAGGPTARLARGRGLNLIQMCFRAPFVHSTVMFRLSAFRKIGGYLDKHPCEDFSLFTRLIRVGDLVGIPQVLVRYRRHGGSATFRRMEDMKRFTREICLDHIHYFLGVPPAQAEMLYLMLGKPAGERPLGAWLFFCRRALRWPACWRPESLAWLLLQTLRVLRGRRGAVPTTAS